MDAGEAFVAISMAAISCDALFSHQEAAHLKERLLQQTASLDMSEAVLRQVMEGLLRSARRESPEDFLDLLSGSMGLSTDKVAEILDMFSVIRRDQEWPNDVVVHGPRLSLCALVLERLSGGLQVCAAGEP